MSVDELKIGEYRRHARLGTVAVYRVLSRTDALVVVEVVSAPGLPVGLHVRYTAAAVSAMEPLDAKEAAALDAR